ncbi:hypothetical protein HUJ04_007683 [Dendroctonus ponderosae]|nr:hypothetical protein HUJ04_007683 [Dendroctonus ponderosae]
MTSVPLTNPNQSVWCNIDRLELIMPRYALKGGEVVLHCDHSVPPEHLHKVEYKKGDDKVLLYVKGRNPACRIWRVRGATLADQYCNATHVRLDNLTFAAGGSYHCVVSMETPSIFTKESDSKELTIIDPQKGDPRISFTKQTFAVGDKLEANCTTFPSRPSPYITWFINDKKVPDHLTRSYSNGLHAHGFFETRAPSIKQISVEVSELHGDVDNKLRLTCVATIPGYVNKEQKYADIRNATVELIIVDEFPAAPSPVEAASSSAEWIQQVAELLLLQLSLYRTRHIDIV